MGLVGRLLLLLAVLLMPLGMAPSSAAEHRGAMVGTAMEHCPGQSSRHQHSDGMATCSMACASALPAQELKRDETFIKSHELVVPMPGRALQGIHPEIGTPPPRLA